jgi:hypothetical protein
MWCGKKILDRLTPVVPPSISVIISVKNAQKIITEARNERNTEKRQSLKAKKPRGLEAVESEDKE